MSSRLVIAVLLVLAPAAYAGQWDSFVETSPTNYSGVKTQPAKPAAVAPAEKPAKPAAKTVAAKPKAKAAKPHVAAKRRH